jgi:hypothetical protein
MDWLALAITGGFGLLTAVVAAAIAARTARTSGQQAHQPDVPDAWSETRLARSLMFAFQDWGYAQRGGWKGYARRMVDLHGDDGAAFTPAERAVLETPPPDALTPKA